MIELSKSLQELKYMNATTFKLMPMPHGYAHIYIANDIRNLYETFGNSEMREYFKMFIESGIDIKYLQSFMQKKFPEHSNLLNKMLVLM